MGGVFGLWGYESGRNSLHYGFISVVVNRHIESAWMLAFEVRPAGFGESNVAEFELELP